MRWGGTIVVVLAIAALLHSRRKPLEDARDERGDGDCYPYPLSGAWGLPLPRADAGRDVRNYVPAFSAEVEDDGFVTIFHTPEIRRD